jgi:hypothetical protein
MKNNLQGNVMFDLYVDDLIFTGDGFIIIQEFKQSIVKEFEITDLVLMTYFLEI